MEMDELEYKIFEEGIVKSVAIKKILPCLIDEGRIRLVMQLDSALDEIIPLLTTKYPPGKVNYIEHKKILTISVYDRVITIYPSGKITMNNTRDIEEGIEIVGVLMKKINEVYLEIQRGGATHQDLTQRLSKIGPLAIYNCLPKTNCGDCGEATCMAFSMKLLSGESTLDKCIPLFKKEHQKNVENFD